MNDLRTAAQQALEALQLPCPRWNGTQSQIVNAAIDALRAALTEPVQEQNAVPVAPYPVRKALDGLALAAYEAGAAGEQALGDCAEVADWIGYVMLRHRAALAEPVQEPTLDEAMAGPRALAQAYENGWNAAKAEPDLSRCPKCGGPADNGHDRCIPPNPYHCTKCMEQTAVEDEIRLIRAKQEGYEAGWNAALAQRTLTDEVIAELWHKNGGFHHHFARAIERWLKAPT